MRFLSWNVNGIRACAQKGFLNWFAEQDADILCLQETKAHPDQLDEGVLTPPGYQSVWDSAEKKGYSGVAIYTKTAPLSIVKGLSEKRFDREGRTLTLEFENFYLINAYFPNGQRDHARVPFKMEYCSVMTEYARSLRRQGKAVVICGDFNTAHREIDLRNPRQNLNTTGFLPHERAWLDTFIKDGFFDAFRQKNAAPHQYTWWSYRPGVRARNIGWRLDYFFISQEIVGQVKNAFHQPHVLGSDHCPVGLELA